MVISPEIKPLAALYPPPYTKNMLYKAICFSIIKSLLLNSICSEKV